MLSRELERIAEEARFQNEQVLEIVEKIIGRFELDIKQKTTLSAYPGCVHYHVKPGKLAGVMEITYWPKERRLWVDIHDNRRAEWNVRMMPLFVEALEEAFHA